jgi:hypothetical protein
MPQPFDGERDELTGEDQGDRTGAAEAGRAADDQDVRDRTTDIAEDRQGGFDPSSLGDETGEVM